MPQLVKLVLYHKAWQEAGRRFWRTFGRPLILGVRAIVLDGERRVFLVRHTYRRGWYLPGGGVDAGETLEDALVRELAEEAHVRLKSPAHLHGVFLQKTKIFDDHIAVFIVRDFEHWGTREPDWEIAETGFFSLDALPSETTRATRARLAEALDGKPLSALW